MIEAVSLLPPPNYLLSRFFCRAEMPRILIHGNPAFLPACVSAGMPPLHHEGSWERHPLTHRSFFVPGSADVCPNRLLKACGIDGWRRRCPSSATRATRVSTIGRTTCGESTTGGSFRGGMRSRNPRSNGADCACGSSTLGSFFRSGISSRKCVSGFLTVLGNGNLVN